MGAPRRWIKQLLGLKKSEKIASSEEENNSGSAGGKSLNQSGKPSVEPEKEKSRYEIELNENVDTEFEDANWQWEMDQAGAVPATSLQSKSTAAAAAAASKLSDDPPAISPPRRAERQQDWREEWMGAYAKEGNFKSAQDSPNSPEEEEEEEESASPSRLDDDGGEGWATPDVREMFDSDPDPDPSDNYAPLDGEDANFLDSSNSEEDLQEESAAKCIQTAIRGFMVQNEAESETPLPMNEQSAAIRIQTAYRGFKARRSYRAIKGLARLQSLVKGHTVKRQAAIALRCIQALVKVQAHSRAKHVRSTLENQSVQKKLMQQLDVEAPPSKKLDKYTQNGWCDKAGSAAEVRARWQKRQEAAAKREKARAYAQARQWQAGIRQQPQQQQQQPQQQQPQPQQQQEATAFPAIKSEWGWNWLERWMAVRPWETNLLDEAVPTRANEHVPSLETTSPLAERKPLSIIGSNGKTIPRFNITVEKSPSPRKPVAALEGPTSRSPRTPVKAIGSRSFSTPRERSNLSDYQDKKRLSLPGTVHGARLLAQAGVSSPRTQSPRVQSPKIQSPRTPQKAGIARSKVINGNDPKPSKLSR